MPKLRQSYQPQVEIIYREILAKWWVIFYLNLIKDDVTSLAIDAITKEMKFESFAEQEELQRESNLEIKGRSDVEEVKDKMVIW